MTLHIPLRRVATLVVLASLAVALLPGLAAAHAELVTPTPADKATVTQPVAEVSGIYSEPMKSDGASIIVKNATGATVAQGTVDPANNLRMMAIPAAPLGSGAYSVDWTSVAVDGHVERGTWTFTVAVAATVAPTPVATAAPSASPTPVAVSVAPSVGPTPAPSSAGTPAGSSGDVLLPIIVAMVILVAGATYLLSRRGRPVDRT
jgi:methionine-rich copper-binding protein CopC